MIISLRDVNKTYPGVVPLHVLKDINLEIARGELVSIMGASGSGKSTLLNILGILDNYDSGEYLLDGGADTRPEREPCSRATQPFDWFCVPVFQPHQLQKRPRECGPAALLSGHRPQETQRHGHGTTRAPRPGRPCDTPAGRTFRRSETARGYCKGYCDQSIDNHLPTNPQERSTRTHRKR